MPLFISEENIRTVLLEYMLQEKLGYVSINATINANRDSVKLSITKEDEDDEFLEDELDEL